ncbi:hypothetical protein JR064_01950 [Xanthomonas sp. CFBP 8703]|uniref:Uncharacterized protein n=1 Tax=Xanthomonas bonasiae TaxID=2810351 RepID=A0ABS3AX26_9XANT|nr:hypothetical protein [Xanthomonas bonasiae]MBN6100924.1 hypothetical protein [Xanthomonas bonasiae]
MNPAMARRKPIDFHGFYHIILMNGKKSHNVRILIHSAIGTGDLRIFVIRGSSSTRDLYTLPHF